MVNHLLARGAALLLSACMIASPASAAFSGGEMIFARPGENSYTLNNFVPAERSAPMTARLFLSAPEEEAEIHECFNSEITVGVSLNEHDAAMRLYYLGMLSGSGTKPGGGIEFSLEKV